MWQRVIISLLYMVSACSAWSQDIPSWLDSRSRKQHFPDSRYLTGFVQGTVASGENWPDAITRLKKEAQALLTESIKMEIESKKQLLNRNYSDNTTEIFHTVFTSDVQTTAGAEIVQLKTETYYNPKAKLVYAFAYVNKRELADYYRTIIAANLQGIKSMLNTATQWEQQQKKAQARKQYEAAANLLTEAAEKQEVLLALGMDEALPAPTWGALRDSIAQGLVRTEMTVYVNAREDLFGQPCAIVAHKLQAKLTEAGYRFITDEQAADYTLYIRATTRKIGDAATTIVFCFADVVVEWVDGHTRKIMYKDEQSHKGGSTTWERAGREALETAAEAIIEKLNKIIK